MQQRNENEQFGGGGGANFVFERLQCDEIIFDGFLESCDWAEILKFYVARAVR